jgi:hypothetical protein
MKKYFLGATIVISVNCCTAQAPDTATFFLHKFAQNIGRETFKRTDGVNNITYDIDFKFVDRTTPVPLRAHLVTTTDHEPLSLFIKGNTSRFSTIDDTVRIQNKTAFIRVNDSAYSEAVKPNSFPVGGYSPGTVQMALLLTGRSTVSRRTFTCCQRGASYSAGKGPDILYNKPLCSKDISGNMGQ